MFFESLPYKVDPVTGLVDYEKLAETANLFKPNMIICGGSAYPREWDYQKFREIADSCGALLMMDMAHISGLVATGEAASPFEYCDIVTTTTHKSLRGPRSGMIFCKNDERGFPDKINFAVFPMLQGGPHMHQIAGLACQLKQVVSPEFKSYIQQVKAKAKALGDYLVVQGYDLATGGTDNHLLLWDLRKTGLTGSKMEKTCDRCKITLNKNCVPGDRSALAPGGVRIGAPALTTRGLKEADFVKVGEFLHRAVQSALKLQEQTGKKLKDFVAAMPEDADMIKISEDVATFANDYFMPGV
jgi:glycine hydroxymethyltransferase